jgi:signal transduction histidine kinase
MVRDSGAGMSPDLAERALNPFFTSKAASGHEGLGLSVAYGVVCQSGGHMEIENGEGDGAKVDLYFPRSTGVSGTSDADVHIVSPKRRSAG